MGSDGRRVAPKTVTSPDMTLIPKLPITINLYIQFIRRCQNSTQNEFQHTSLSLSFNATVPCDVVRQLFLLSKKDENAVREIAAVVSCIEESLETPLLVHEHDSNNNSTYPSLLPCAVALGSPRLPFGPFLLGNGFDDSLWLFNFCKTLKEFVLADVRSSGSGEELGSLAGVLATKRRRAASALIALTAAMD